MRALRTALAAFLLAFLAKSPSASAGEDLAVPDWLARPGVRLVAVEFYATWCKPCMEAMPRWKALQAKYYKQGLRVVVVNTLDPDGGCRSIGWVPDELVCDLEGRLGDAFQLEGKLPAAFLWSWQGSLLVKRGHIEEVEKTVEAYLRSAPRVVVEAGADVPPAVVGAVREQLTDDGKLLVLAVTFTMLPAMRRTAAFARESLEIPTNGFGHAIT